uniref:Capsid protein n=1 Tax=Torque teno Arctocephalus gazella virus 2 TaxID=2249933 RepID=A0A2Z4N3I6_9VIRU|nr:ORF1 [Torque teno Arctocephalus gazella virus 2]
MPYRRRRNRRGFRRRWWTRSRGKWRHRRRNYGRWRRSHRRRYFRSGLSTVRIHKSRRHKYIYVKGLEPLGNLCFNNSWAKSEATPYKSLEKETGAIWSGTFGAHHFTFGNLLQRAACRFAVFSGNWETYDYMTFCGGTIYLPIFDCVDYMFGTDNQFENLRGVETVHQGETSWLQPLWLLLQRGTHIIFGRVRKPNWTRWRRLRVKPPPTWEGVYHFPHAFSLILFQWWWTWFDFNHAFFDLYGQEPAETEEGQVHEHCFGKEPWWFNSNKEDVKNKNCDAWVNRYKYSDPPTNRDGFEKNDAYWGPMLPAKFDQCPVGASVFFIYKLKFKVTGDSEYRQLPSQAREQIIPPAPAPTGPLGEVSSSALSEEEEDPPLSKRPRDTGDILWGDTDESGILKPSSLKRISSAGRTAQPLQLERGGILSRRRVRFRRRDVHRDHLRRRIKHLLNRLSKRGGGYPPL